jgi:hypothetical protein
MGILGMNHASQPKPEAADPELEKWMSILAQIDTLESKLSAISAQKAAADKKKVQDNNQAINTKVAQSVPLSAPIPTPSSIPIPAPSFSSSPSSSCIPGKKENALSSYQRAQRLLALCDLKISALENDLAAFEEMPVRDFRNLVRCVHDLEKASHAYAELIDVEENPSESIVTAKALPAQGYSALQQVGATQAPLLSSPSNHPLFGKKHGKQKKSKGKR